MVAFIDDHREEHGVEPICEQLPIAPSTPELERRIPKGKGASAAAA